MRKLTPFFILPVAALLGTVYADQQSPKPHIKPQLSLTIEEGYDDNIYDQDRGPHAKEGSWITSLQPVVGANIQFDPWTASVAYQPDYRFYHAEDRESYLRHIFTLNLGAHSDPWTFQAGAWLGYTEGTLDEMAWVPPGGLPVLCATEVRDRRRNFKHLYNLSLRWDSDRYFARLVGEARFWDFKARQRTDIPFYHNHTDRNDSNFGFDVGWKPEDEREVYFGYRFGLQGQNHYPGGVPYVYHNTYHRILFGTKAKLTEWLSFDGVVGPSFHFFDEDEIQPAGDDQETLLYFRVQATANLNDDVLLKLGGRQFLLPSSAGRFAYQNIKWWLHAQFQILPQLQGTTGFEVAEFDFLPGVSIRDRTYAPMVGLQWDFYKHCSLGAQYAYTWTDALAHDQDHREFEKHQVFFHLTWQY